MKHKLVDKIKVSVPLLIGGGAIIFGVWYSFIKLPGDLERISTTPQISTSQMDISYQPGTFYTNIRERIREGIRRDNLLREKKWFLDNASENSASYKLQEELGVNIKGLLDILGQYPELTKDLCRYNWERNCKEYNKTVDQLKTLVENS